jgi:hypothetical protein
MGDNKKEVIMALYVQPVTLSRERAMNIREGAGDFAKVQAFTESVVHLTQKEIGARGADDRARVELIDIAALFFLQCPR